MFWRRFRVFVSIWWRLFAWGQSRTKKVVTVLGLIFTVIGIPALLNSDLVLNLLLKTPHVFTVRVGVLVGAVLLAAWALITGALAWERSGVPVLIVGDTLEWDGVRYRLTLACKDKPCDASVRLLEIVDATGRHIVPPRRLNLDLEWTHHGGRGDVHVKANETESVSVATIREEGNRTLLSHMRRKAPFNIIPIIRRDYCCESLGFAKPFLFAVEFNVIVSWLFVV